MGRDIKIKVCGMRNPENIAALSELNPDYMGFIFYPKSKRFIADQLDAASLDFLPSSIQRVGVFVNATMEEVIQGMNLLKLDLIQLHGDEPPEYCRALYEMDVPAIKAFGVDENFDFTVTEAYAPYCQYFLFDTKSANYGGTGQKFDWGFLKKYNNALPVFLSGGLGLEDASQVLACNWLNLHAVDLNSRFEIEAGMKDIDKLKAFFGSMEKS